MKVKNVNLEWYALRWDFNNNKLVRCNVLGNDFKDEVYKKIKNKSIKTKDDLKKSLKSYLMYRYWCKAEHEILVSYHFSNSNTNKIDIYYQLEPNLDIMVDYIINKMDIKF